MENGGTFSRQDYWKSKGDPAMPNPARDKAILRDRWDLELVVYFASMRIATGARVFLVIWFRSIPNFPRHEMFTNSYKEPTHEMEDI